MIILVSLFFFILLFRIWIQIICLIWSLRKQSTFRGATNSFFFERRNSILMTCHYPQDGISALVLQSSFREETILVASQNVGFFLRLKNMDNTSTSVVWKRPLCPIILKCPLLAVFTLETDNPSSQSVYPFQAWKLSLGKRFLFSD